ncbi:MAG: lipopolysaccharide biosynthesis protein [Gemmatimonadales bacterium]
MDRYFDTDHLQTRLKTLALRGGAVTMATQTMSFAFTLGATAILARLLTPADYGLIAMVTVIVGFMTMFKDFGLSMATVQRAELTQPQVSTLFWLNTALGLSLSILAVGLAPALAWFYSESRLVPLTIFLASTFMISGLGVQHQALLRRQMRYGVLAAIEILALICGIVLAIATAMRGGQYWALAIQTVTSTTFRTLGYWILCRWRPSLPRRRADIGSMLAFGGNLAASNVVNYATRNFDQVLIGRVWGDSELGAYERASRLLQMPLRLINTPISHVAIPILCRLQHDSSRYREYYLKALYSLAFIVMPGMAFITVMAGDLVSVLMGDQWAEAGTIFGVLGILGLILPVSNTNGWHFIASGTTNRMLRWSMIDGAVIVVAFLIGVPYGGLGVAVAFVAARMVLFVPGIWYATQTVPVDVSDVLRRIRVPLLSSLAVIVVLRISRQTILPGVEVGPRLVVAFAIAAFAYLFFACVICRSFSPLTDLPRLILAVFRTRAPNADDVQSSDAGSSESSV